MWRSVIAAACALIMMAGCTAASEPMAVDVFGSMDPSDPSVVISGDAADEGLVCSEGTNRRLAMEDMEGNPISDEEGVANWEEALDSGATLEVLIHEEVNCADGSGAFVIEFHNVVQPAALDYEGSNEVGTWTIDGGTGDYETLSGEGDAVADFGAGAFGFTGEIQNA